MRSWRRRNAELDEEIQGHLQAMVRERMERGEPRHQAEAAARREFGNVELVKEVTRDMWGWGWLDRLLQDLRYGLRMLRRNPGLTLIAVLILGLGIGANGAVFSVANAILLRPLPAVEPEDLVWLRAVTAEGKLRSTMSYPNYVDLRQTEVFDGLLATHLAAVVMRGGSGSRQGLGEVVSGNYFSVLGLGAAIGRPLVESDDHPGAERVVVLGHESWQRQFGGDAGIIGRTLVLNGEAFTVVGVAEQGFPGLFLGVFGDFWVPFQHASSWIGPDVLTNRDAPAIRLLGRLADGVELLQAQAAADVVMERLAGAYPVTNEDESVRLSPARMLEGSLRAGVTAFLAILMGFVALVLVTACANFVNLLLTRATGRRRELAVRQALGASWGRLLRQHITEGSLLAILAGAAGLFFGVFMTRLLEGFNPLPASIPIHFDFTPDARVLLLIALVSGATALILGLVPGLKSSRFESGPTLKDESLATTGSRRSSGLRGALVVVQVALSLVLLIGATLFLRSLENAQQIELGFDVTNISALDLELMSKDKGPEQAEQIYRQLLGRVRAMPGVRSAVLSSRLPLDRSTPRVGTHIEGHEPPIGELSWKIRFYRISPNYFNTLGIPLLRGRDFTEGDDTSRAGVAIISETMARRFWAGEDPIGRSFRLADAAENRELAGRNMADESLEIVGVARDVKVRTLGEEPTPHFYVPYRQRSELGRTLIIRGVDGVDGLVPAVQRKLESGPGNVAAFFGRTLDEHVAFSLVPSRLAAAVSAVFGLLALLLATLGLYGVVAFSVVQRTREIGILMALGAQTGDIVRRVLGAGLRLIGIGLAVGFATALALAHLLDSVLYQVNPTDPSIFAGVGLLMVVTALMACLIPALKAARVDPLIALRL